MANRDDRWSPTAHAAMGSGVGFLNPLAALEGAANHAVGQGILGKQKERSLGSYVGHGAAGGAALMALMGALFAYLLRQSPSIAKGNVLRQLLAGAGVGAGVGGLSGTITGGLGKLSDYIAE